MKSKKNEGVSPRRTEDFIGAVDEAEKFIDGVTKAVKDALPSIAAAYRHSHGEDRYRVGIMVEEFGKVSDALAVINGIMGYELRPHEEGKIIPQQEAAWQQ